MQLPAPDQTVSIQSVTNGDLGANASSAGTCSSLIRQELETERTTKMKQQSKGLAVITGASSGIGAVYADRLARRGYDLLLVARTRGPMDELAKKLEAGTGRKIEILAADLTDSKDLAGVERILREDARITLLVNNAGMASTAPLVNADVSEMSRIITLNVSALTRLTYAAVP